ncbi:MAG: tetratricopeptide repeat protein, partial [Candidatus Scalindua sp.]
QLKTTDPLDIYSYENLGVIYAKQGDYKSAAKEWQTLLKLHPRRTDIKDKLNKVERLIKVDSENVQTNLSGEKVNLLGHGIEYYKNRDYESAIKIFNQVINDFPDLKEAYSFLGNAYFRNKMFREALLAYEKVKQIDKGDITAYENVGVIYAKQGAFDRALNEWKIILQFNPQRNDIENKIEKVSQLMSQ